MSESSDALEADVQSAKTKLAHAINCRIWILNISTLTWSSAYNLFQLIAILSGPIVAILTALGENDSNKNSMKIWIVLVSNAGSAATALIGRLRIGDVVRARQIALAAVNNCALKLNEIVSPKYNNKKEFMDEVTKLRQRLAGISYEQVNLLWPPRQEVKDGNT